MKPNSNVKAEENHHVPPSFSTITSLLETLISRIENLEIAVLGHDLAKTQITTPESDTESTHCPSCTCSISTSCQETWKQTDSPAVMSEAPGRWYSVTRGKNVGVFNGWHNVCPLVVGVAQSCFQRHATKAAADAEYADAKKNGLVVLV